MCVAFAVSLEVNAQQAHFLLDRAGLSSGIAVERAGIDFPRFAHDTQPADLPPETPERKSPFLGVLYSLLLPGMGELYADRFERGRMPLIAEGVMWLGVLGFTSYGGWIQDDARTLAAQYAGIVNSGKDEQYYANIGNYISIEEYNSAKLVERNLAALYPEDISSGFQWRWDSDEKRSEYRDLRILSDEMYNAVTFVVLGMIANRLWSAIQTGIFIKDYNKTADQLPKSRLFILPDRLPGVTGISGWRVSFSQTF